MTGEAASEWRAGRRGAAAEQQHLRGRRSVRGGVERVGARIQFCQHTASRLLLILFPAAAGFFPTRRMWSSLFVASLLGLASVAASPVKPGSPVQPLKEVNLFGFDCAKAHGRNAKDACARTNFCLSEAKTQSAKDECGRSFSLRRPLGVGGCLWGRAFRWSRPPSPFGRRPRRAPS